VCGEGGAPVPGVTVTIGHRYLADDVPGDVHFGLRAVSDADGLVEMWLPAGRYTFLADPPRSVPWGPASLSTAPVHDDVRLALALPRTYSVRGVATSAAGDLVHTARVAANQLDAEDPYYDTSWIGTDGTYALKLPQGRFAISVHPSAPVGRPFPPQLVGELVVTEDRTFDIAVLAGAALTVQCVDEHGQSVPHVQFSVAPVPVGYEGYSDFRVQGESSGGEGNGTVGVLPGMQRITVDRVPAPYLEPDPVLVHVVRDTTVQLVLPRGVQLSGSMVDESGQPLPLQGVRGGYIRVSGMTSSVMLAAPFHTAGGAAAFSVALAPGSYRLSLELPWGTGGDATVPSQVLGVWEVLEDAQLTLEVRSGVRVQGQVLIPPPAEMEFGTLTFSNGSTLFGGRAQLQADGAYSVSLLPGVYEVRATFGGSVGHPPSQSLGTVTVSGDTLLHWTAAHGHWTAGRIVSRNQSELTGLSLQAASVATDAASSTPVQNYTTAGEDGSFGMWLLAGTYWLTAHTNSGSSLSGFSFSRRRLAELAVPSPGPLEIHLPSGAMLYAQVTTPSGDPAAASVELYPAPFTLRQVADGTPLVELQLGDGEPQAIGLSPGQYAAVVQPRGADAEYLGQVVPAFAAEGDTDLDVVMRSADDAVTLSGRLATPQGSAPMWARLFLYEPQQRVIQTLYTSFATYAIDVPRGTYQTVIEIQDQSGNRQVYEYGEIEVAADRTWDILLATAVVQAQAPTPHTFALQPTYPNPFNSHSAIGFSLPTDAHTLLVVYDILGRRVRTLVDGAQRAGGHRIVWDGRHDNGELVSTGVYVCRLRAGQYVATRRMLLLK
jgi:hypothetical protein